MATETDLTRNTPGWYDLGTPDVDGARAFYSGLFGWTGDAVPDPEAGGYGFFNLAGRMVGGIGPLQDPSQPIAWSVYMLVESAAGAVSRSREAGGTVLIEPMEVMGQGTMAFVADPSGAAIGLWQPAAHRGVEVRDEPGSAAWTELHSNDVTAVGPFYQAVFGWEPNASQIEGMDYTEFKVGDRSVAGGTALRPGEEGVPSHWLVYFAAADVDASTARAAELGGTVLAQPMDFPGGRFSVIRDPQGAVFGLLRMS